MDPEIPRYHFIWSHAHTVVIVTSCFGFVNKYVNIKRNAHGALNRIYKYCPRRSTTCGFYQDQLDRMLLLTRKQQGQGFVEVNLSQYLESFAVDIKNWLTFAKRSLCHISHGYVFVCLIVDSCYFLVHDLSLNLTYHRILTGATRRVSAAHQELLNLLEHHMSPLVFVEFMLFYLLFCVRCFVNRYFPFVIIFQCVYVPLQYLQTSLT